MSARLRVVLLVLCAGCVPATILRRNLVALVREPRAVERTAPPKPGAARLVVHWVGHATVLVQLDDRFVLTDPVLTQSVAAGFSRRLVQPGLLPAELPPLDLVLISHMHLDHLSVGSLEMLEGGARQLLVPETGLVYVPDLAFPTDEVARWQTFTQGELRVTAAPVKHPGARYGLDSGWMTASATGWVIEYHGLTVYFGGDTALDLEAFRATSARFPSIDLALLPIGPVDPPAFARPTHLDGAEALEAFTALRARHLVPIHYDTFAHGIDEPGTAVALLRRAMQQRSLGEDRVHVLPIGGRWALPLTSP